MSLNAGHSPADLIDTGLPAEDLRQRVNSGDCNLYDSSAALAAFFNMAQNTRYRQLADVDRNISTGDYTAALSALSNINSYRSTETDGVYGITIADGAEADDIVAQYVNFYTVLIKSYRGDTLSAADTNTVLLVSGLCPHNYGTVVYEAGAFYKQLTGTDLFYGDCGEDGGDGSRYTRKQTDYNPAADPKQMYSLYPNPTGGNLIVQQNIIDNQQIVVDVYDAMGIKVKKMALAFTGYTQSFNFDNLTPGLYLLHIANSSNRTFDLKFVKE